MLFRSSKLNCRPSTSPSTNISTPSAPTAGAKPSAPPSTSTTTTASHPPPATPNPNRNNPNHPNPGASTHNPSHLPNPPLGPRLPLPLLGPRPLFLLGPGLPGPTIQHSQPHPLRANLSYLRPIPPRHNPPPPPVPVILSVAKDPASIPPRQPSMRPDSLQPPPNPLNPTPHRARNLRQAATPTPSTSTTTTASA